MASGSELSKRAWPIWLAANGVGWLLAYALAQLVARTILSSELIAIALEEADYFWLGPLDSAGNSILYGLVIGLILGLAQGVVLRRLFDIKFGWWVGASLLVFGLRQLLAHWELRALAEVGAENVSLFGLAIVLIAGILFVLPQWYVLNRRFEKAGWWVPATLLGIGLGTRLFQETDALLEWIALTLLCGLVYGFATGLALRNMKLRRQFASEENATELGDVPG